MDNQATMLSDLPGGALSQSQGFQPQQSHSVVDIRDMTGQMQQPMQNFRGDSQDPLATPLMSHYKARMPSSAKEGFISLLLKNGTRDFKEPLLVAAIVFVIYQDFMINIIAMLIPQFLRWIILQQTPGIVPSIVKALLVGIFFFIIKTFFYI